MSNKPWVDIRTCWKCGNGKSRVYDVREQPNGEVVRRRECTECGYRWKTIETLFSTQYQNITQGGNDNVANVDTEQWSKNSE